MNVDYSKAKYIIDAHVKEIIWLANLHCMSMVKRGGGVINIRHWRIFHSDIQGQDVMVIELLIDVKEAMGANVTNTVCEGISPYIQSLLENSKVGLRILSNLCVERMTRSEFW